MRGGFLNGMKRPVGKVVRKLANCAGLTLG